MVTGVLFVWAMPMSILALLECWKGGLGRHSSVDIWGTIPLCVMWIIWRECNSCTFEGTRAIAFGVKIVIILCYV